MAPVSDDEKLRKAQQLFGSELLSDLLANLDRAAKSLDDFGVERKESDAEDNVEAEESDETDEDTEETKEDDSEEDDVPPALVKAVKKVMNPLMKEMASMKGMMHSHDAEPKKKKDDDVVSAVKQVLAENNKVFAAALAKAMQDIQVRTVKSATASAMTEIAQLTQKVEKARNTGSKAKARAAEAAVNDEDVDKSDKSAMPLSQFFEFAGSDWNK